MIYYICIYIYHILYPYYYFAFALYQRDIIYMIYIKEKFAPWKSKLDPELE